MGIALDEETKALGEWTLVRTQSVSRAGHRWLRGNAGRCDATEALSPGSRVVGDDMYNWYFIFSSDNYRSRRERGRPVELLNACSVLIESGRSPAGDRASGSLAIGRWIWYI